MIWRTIPTLRYPFLTACYILLSVRQMITSHLPYETAGPSTWLFEMLQPGCPLFRLITLFRLNGLWINFLVLQLSRRALYVCTFKQLLQLIYSKSECLSYKNMSWLTGLIWTPLPIVAMQWCVHWCVSLYLSRWYKQQFSQILKFILEMSWSMWFAKLCVASWASCRGKSFYPRRQMPL